MKRAFLVLALLAGCGPSSIEQPAQTVNVDAEGRVAIESVRAAVRAEAQRLYGQSCGEVVVPDGAFEPIEITGGGPPEYAVLFGRARCGESGNANQWLGTGGANVQIWHAFGGPPRMLLDHQMHGFTPKATGLVSLQHGGFCPGGAGPGMCLVRYRWNDRDSALEVSDRRLYDDGHPGQPPRMEWDYERIAR